MYLCGQINDYRTIPLLPGITIPCVEENCRLARWMSVRRSLLKSWTITFVGCRRNVFHLDPAF